jgi:hypothetical protein
LFKVIESIANFFEPRFGFFASSFKQIDNGEIQVGHIAILSVAFVEFFQAIATRVELSFVEQRTRQRDAFGVRRAARA